MLVVPEGADRRRTGLLHGEGSERRVNSFLGNELTMRMCGEEKKE